MYVSQSIRIIDTLGDKPLQDKWRPRLFTRTCIFRPQCVTKDMEIFYYMKHYSILCLHLHVCLCMVTLHETADICVTSLIFNLHPRSCEMKRQSENVNAIFHCDAPVMICQGSSLPFDAQPNMSIVFYFETLSLWLNSLQECEIINYLRIPPYDRFLITPTGQYNEYICFDIYMYKPYHKHWFALYIIIILTLYLCCHCNYYCRRHFYFYIFFNCFW